MTTRWIITVARVPLALASIVLAACGDGGGQETDTNTAQPITVRSAPVTNTVIARTIVAAGTVAPKDEISLSFKVGGVIERIAVDPGDIVRAGQMLATLDLREIDAGLTKARSVAAKAERDLDRARRLYADSVVTLAQMQDAETASELARADVEGAAFNRRYAVIVAPASGAILRRSAEPGETVSSGTTVLVLGSRARGSVVEVGLADRDAVLVHNGDPAVARFDALPDMEFHGRVSQVAAAADRGTGTYAVEISLRGASDLTAGLVGHVEIRPGTGAPATLVPIEAILEADGSQATVYALSLDGKRAERRRVTVAFIDGNRVAVARGLEGVANVLTDGAAYVDEGSVVRVTP
jgi:multidrug efflux system membrane fusion protein